ncbi:hypothetical protein ASD45_18650 [Pseudolabrys sp. Root1462]|uniref:hypothetical protein n=1 Tax=Pseudolabrys sp. Root1462 TaxID=1736466 RepID=UPI0007034BA1|nr:hypothetical protein [Pseudolabrys sp. Root1462]KQY98007.1 hypothetical protein ASD45_18650 [Pseudolabrys sp. Root1462]
MAVLADRDSVNYYGSAAAATRHAWFKVSVMSLKTIGLGILAGALCAAMVTPAAAEFFGCKDPHTKVTYSSSSSRQAFARYSTSHTSHEYSSRRTRSAGLFAPFSRPSNERW